MGQIIGPQAHCEAIRYFNGQFSCPSDTNGDGVVSTADVLYLLGFWTFTDCTADIDRDGTVNTADLLQLLGEWGQCP